MTLNEGLSAAEREVPAGMPAACTPCSSTVSSSLNWAVGGPSPCSLWYMLLDLITATVLYAGCCSSPHFYMKKLWVKGVM